MIADNNLESAVKLQQEYFELEKRINLLNTIFEIMFNGDKIVRFFEQNNIKQIAIYAYGQYGQYWRKALESIGVNVICAIDKNAKAFSDILFHVYDFENAPKNIDALIISTINIEREEIQRKAADSGLYAYVFSPDEIRELLY